MSVAKTDYPKSKVLRLFRAWADQDSTWQNHVGKLAGVECIGTLPPIDPDFPAAILHPALGTSLDKRDLRHSMRDICDAVKLAPQVTNTILTEAFDDRIRSQELADDFYSQPLQDGKYFDRRREIDGLKSAEERARKTSVIDAERRRLSLVKAEAADRYSKLADIRTQVDNTASEFGAAFPGHRPWRMPINRPAIDPRERLRFVIDELNFDLDFGDDAVHFIDTIGGKLLGSCSGGPMYFPSLKSAVSYCDKGIRVAVSNRILNAHNVEQLVRFYSERPQFTSDRPAGGLFLFEQFPELLVAAPVDSVELDRALELAVPDR